MRLTLLFKIISIFIFSCMGMGMAFEKYQRVQTVHSNSNSIEERLQNILDEAVNEFKLPGVQAGILLPDGSMVLASSGTVDFERKKALIRPDNIFKVGSTTKMVVSALIGRLVDKGLLKYQDTLVQWFPELPAANTVTVRDLLNHTSGIEENLFMKPEILMESALNPHKRWNPETVMGLIMKGQKIKPVEKRSFHYANNNYVILGLIAEKAAGEALHKQLNSEFFAPLGLSNTYLLPYYDQVPENLIPAYDEYIPFGPHIIKPDQTSWDSLSYAAGAMGSTAQDLLRWLDALFHDKLLTPETLQKMRLYSTSTNNGRDNSMVQYGLGLARYEINGELLEGHPGGGFGGECFPFYSSRRNCSIVICYNWSKKDNPAGKVLLSRILKLLD